MRIRSTCWVVGLFCVLAFAPAACSPGNPSEPAEEQQRNEAIAEKIEEKATERNTKEKTADDAGVGPEEEAVPEPKATEQGVTEPPQEVVVEEPSTPTPDEMVPEIIPESMFPKDGLGQLSGQCNVLDDEEWNSSKSFFFRNTIDFGTMPFDKAKLTQGGRKIWDDGNLGGSSVHSEVFAYEVLYRCESAALLKSEGEIVYQDKGGKKTDLLVLIDQRKIGVSVTRAFHFPPTNPYTEQEANTLLTKKLKDIPLSAKNADSKDAWGRSILHILAYNKQYADVVETAYKKLDASVTSNIVLMVTVTDGKDDHIY
ncbi:MAG: hypothetical protein EP343_34575 [Deltaproteobacteria bacterium]|nr:MAG: hypothetical protein EP343_34575 [Deltaproteobacteria bacterium]